MKNWRSTLAGIAAILSVFARKPIVQIMQTPEDLAIVATGIGLILAKDAMNEDKF